MPLATAPPPVQMSIEWWSPMCFSSTVVDHLLGCRMKQWEVESSRDPPKKRDCALRGKGTTLLLLVIWCRHGAINAKVVGSMPIWAIQLRVGLDWSMWGPSNSHCSVILWFAQRALHWFLFCGWRSVPLNTVVGISCAAGNHNFHTWEECYENQDWQRHWRTWGHFPS